MFAALFSWLASGGIAAIGRELRAAHEAKLRAQNDSERIAADIRIAELEARRDILISEQGSWMTRWIRPALAFPVVVFVWKIILWDTVLGLGTTPDPGAIVMWIVNITVAAYFLTRPFEKRK